ncbi:MAG: LacI family transcriptional regulator [Actinomycetia bacterium]|nr:LacI family transcriptional regulator [Actinomycetes bacterium]MDQ1655453.1 LacI family transcriptional regulator [Cryptosporangiaceae bacterium]
MTARRPTLKDVAERAGVSLKTTSRVLNGEKSVRPETEQRVRDAMTELGFRPNYFARRLRLGADTSSIGLVIEDLSNPFYSGMAHAIEQRAHEHSMLLIIGSSQRQPETERRLVASLSQRRVSGLIVVPAGHNHDHLAAEQERGLRIVCADRPAAGVSADAVVADNEGGARLAVTHLSRHHHKRIAYLGDDPDLYTNQQRLEGYRGALGLHGAATDGHLACLGLTDAAAAERATRELLAGESPPTAIFAGNNLLTIGALHALRAIHRTDVAVVGFDDFEAADLVVPGVTVVRHDPAELGRIAADRLLARIDGDRSAPTVEMLPVHLIARGSGELTP